MANLVYRTQNPHHNQAIGPFLTLTSACRTFRLFKQGFCISFQIKIEREDDKDSTCKLYCVQDCDKKWTFSCKKTLMDHGTYFPDLFRDSSKRLSALFVSVNSLLTIIIDNGLLFFWSWTWVLSRAPDQLDLRPIQFRKSEIRNRYYLWGYFKF